MIFTATELDGAYRIEPERLEDERGFFARMWCQEEFKAHGLNPNLVQCNVSYNKRKGTLRGMHYQVAPHEEAKLVRVTRGAIYDVIVDLRPTSPTYRQWASAELSAENRATVYVPPGFAHGFQTLTDDAEVFYQMSESHHAESSRGLRWDDPALGIEWPLPVGEMSPQDRQRELLPCLHEPLHGNSPSVSMILFAAGQIGLEVATFMSGFGDRPACLVLDVEDCEKCNQAIIRTCDLDAERIFRSDQLYEPATLNRLRGMKLDLGIFR